MTVRFSEVLMGISAAVERVRKDTESAARSEASVLITGEQGIGKAAIARHIHDQRGNLNLPFFAVDCQDGQGGSRAFKNLEQSHRTLSGEVDDGSRWCLRPHTLYLANIDVLGEPAQTSLLWFLGTGPLISCGLFNLGHQP